MGLNTVTRQGQVFRHYWGGDWVSGEDDRLVERRNPANHDDVIGFIPLGSRQHVAAAVAVARRVADEWRNIPAPVRGRIVLEAARLLESRRRSIAASLTREQGKTLVEAHGEVDLAVKVLEYISGEGRRLCGSTFPSELPRKFAYTTREPVGVVGLITPWNFPLAVPIWKIAPALVCGNAIVWKPARLTPLTSEAIVQLFADVGVPPGVLNLVNGSGEEAGGALVTHPDVRAISFTSSYEVGTVIYSDAARCFKKVQCEAGGKNAALVMPDADVEWAAERIVAGAFRYAGQRCTATSRAIVVGNIADDLVEAMAERVRPLVVGDGMQAGTDMGPISEARQLERVEEFLRLGRSEGHLVCGGDRLRGDVHDRGLFVGPTIFDHVDANARVAQEEIFGPVLSIVRVPSPDAAIEAVNANRYGMVSSVFGRDSTWLLDAVDRLKCGMVHVNGTTTESEVHLPFGGIKDTGVGEREMGSGAIDFYSELKVVYVNRAEALNA